MNKILQIFKIKEVRNKVLFVLAMLTIFRLAASIPVPTIDLAKLHQFFQSSELLGLLNIFSGGAMRRFSIVMLGVMPYITGSIIMQLLTMIFPRLEEIYREQGEAGRQKFNQYSRLLCVPLAVLQSFSMIKLLQSKAAIPPLDALSLITTISVITAGTVFLMWLGELISEKGIGNGISLLIFAGIIARLPSATQQVLVKWWEQNWNPSFIPTILGFIAAAVLVVVGVVLVTEAQRRIPVSYAKQVRGRRLYGGASTYLPLRLNQAGVIPIIFAISIMLFPSMVSSMFSQSKIIWLSNAAHFISVHFQMNSLVGGVFYFALVIFFTYFYTAVTFDPNNVSENLQNQGAFIPGIRPGSKTADYIRYVIHRTTLAGAVFLGVIAVLPFIMRSLTNITALAIGGTGLLIVVSVVLETMRQTDSQITMRGYD